MSTVEQLDVKIKADLSGFTGNMSEAEKQLKSAEKAAKELKDKLGKIGEGISTAGAVLTAGLTAPILAAAAAGVKYNATMEDFRANFATLLGSAEEAQKMLGDLKNFADKTPFEMTGLADATKTMLSFGISADEVMGDLKMLGDVSMGNSEKLKGLSLVFGQIKSTGRLMGQDLLQLISNGFNPLQIISEKTGRSMADLKKDMEKGAISADQVTDAFKSATSEGGMFFGAMDKSSKTFNGQMSTLKDTVNSALGEALKPAFNELATNILPGVTNAVKALAESFGQLTGPQQLSVLGFAAATAALGPLLFIIGKVVASWPAMVAGIKAINTALMGFIANPYALAIAAIAIALVAIVGAVNAANAAVERAQKKITDDIVAEGEKRKAAIDKAHQGAIDSLNKELSAEEKASTTRKANLTAEYNAKVESVGKGLEARKKSLQDELKALEDAHKKTIDKIQAEYGVFEKTQKSKTQVVQDETKKRMEALDKEMEEAQTAYELAIKQINEEYGTFEEKHKSKIELIQDEYNSKIELIDKLSDLSESAATAEGETYKRINQEILEAAQNSHDEKIMMYEEEYLASIGLINDELTAKIKGYQDQIDGIKNKTAEENRLEKEASDSKKIMDLEAKVSSATNDADRLEAVANLNAEIERQNKEQRATERQAQIEDLNLGIKNAIASAKIEKEEALKNLKAKLAEQKIESQNDTLFKIEEINKEKKAAVELETAKLKATKARILEQKEIYQAESDEAIKKIQAERIAKEAAENKKFDAVKKSLDDQLAQNDSYLGDYKKKLAKELAEKQKTEDAKLAATKKRIEDELALEKKGIKEQKEAVDKATQKAALDASPIEELQKQLDRMKKLKTSDPSGYRNAGGGTYQAGLEAQIAAEKAALHKAGVPGYATGVKNFAGGIARINEQGGEIVELPNGTNVIPHDVSMEMAKNTSNTQNSITINVNGTENPEIVAQKIVKILRLQGVRA